MKCGFLKKTVPFIICFLTGCSNPQNSENLGENEPAPAEAQSDTTSEVETAKSSLETASGSLAITVETPPGEILKLASAAMESAFDGDTGSAVAGKLEVGLGLVVNESQSSDPLCSTNGSPWSQTGETSDQSGLLDEKDSAYAGRFFYCATNFNTYSPDSILGAFSINKIVACIVDEAFPEGYPTDPSTKTISINFGVAGSCVSAEAAAVFSKDMGTDPLDLQITVEKKAPPSPWTHLIEFSMGSKIQIHLLITPDRVATHVTEYSENNSNQKTGGWQFSLDNNQGSSLARYELFSAYHGDGGVGGSHLRMLLEGVLNSETYSFESVDRIEGLHVQGVQGGLYRPNVLSIKGDSETGFKSLNYKCPYGSSQCDGSIISNYSPIQSNCLPVTSDCLGNDGIEIKSEDDLSFIKVVDIISSTEVVFNPSFLAWVDKPQPMAFNSVTTTLVPANENRNTETTGSYSCSQNLEKTFNRNCSTLFEAASLDAASEQCRKSEEDGGQGCCAASKVFTNRFGEVVSYEVVPAGTAKGAGTTFTCIL